MKIFALADAQFAALLSNSSGKIDNYAGLFGLLPAKFAEIKSGSDCFTYAIDVQQLVKQHSKNRTSYKNLLRSSIKKAIYRLGDERLGLWSDEVCVSVT